MGVLPGNQPSSAFDINFDQPELPQLPAMPIATLDNFINSINSIRQVVQQLGAPATLPKNNNNAGNRSQQPNKPNKQDKPKKSRWIEKTRRTSKQKIYNPDDHDQFVEVEQIDSLIMIDQTTGATWTWTR